MAETPKPPPKEEVPTTLPRRSPMHRILRELERKPVGDG